MKRVLFLLLILVSWQCFGQAYVPMPTDTATWRYRIKQVDDYVTITDFILYLNGTDTTIGGNVYSKIFSRSVTRTGPIGYDPPIAPITATNPDIFYGGIRESGKQVFFIAISTEQMIFDFTAGAGSYIPANIGTIKVVAIDSVLVGSSYHKRYKTTDSTYYVLEGIGSNRGLLPGLNDGSGYVNFYCFTHNTDLWEPVDSIPCTPIYGMGYINAVQKIAGEPELEIFPNPAYNTVRVSCPGRSTLQGVIRNGIGQEVWRGRIDDGVEINVSGWPDGIYYLQLGDSIFRKFVKE